MNSYNGFTAYQRQKGGKLIKKAIEAGVLEDPMKCSCVICGQDKGIRHYHNEDYSPEHIIEDAKVVCWRCHMMIHTRFKHPLSFAKYMMDAALYKKQYPPIYSPTAWNELHKHYFD